jgi:hypothetical protein
VVRIWNESIGIRDNPLVIRILPRRGINCRNGNVDPAPSPGDVSEIETFAAADIENRLVHRDHFRNRAEQRLRDSASMQAAAGGDRFRTVSGLSGTLVLRLQQIDVSAPCDIKRVSSSTPQTAAVTS